MYLASVVTLAALVLCTASVHAQSAACDKPELSREQVTEIALREGTAQGVRLGDQTEIKITENGCEYDVLVTRKPAGPGEYFFVVIGRDKQVVGFRRGL